jgi:hypothetical protein
MLHKLSYTSIFDDCRCRCWLTLPVLFNFHCVWSLCKLLKFHKVGRVTMSCGTWVAIIDGEWNVSMQVLRSDEGRQLRARHQENVRYLRKKLLDAGLPVIQCPSHIIPISVRYIAIIWWLYRTIGASARFAIYKCRGSTCNWFCGVVICVGPRMVAAVFV